MFGTLFQETLFIKTLNKCNRPERVESKLSHHLKTFSLSLFIRKLKEGKSMNIQVDSNGKSEEMLNDMISFRQVLLTKSRGA